MTDKKTPEELAERQSARRDMHRQHRFVPRGLSPIERFWFYTEKGVKEGDCWIWRGPTDKDGYGRITVGCKPGTTRPIMIRAHRFAYINFIGSFSNDLHVCHKCDNPSCVNPGHLWIGTNLDNLEDKYLKRRCNWGPMISIKQAIQALELRSKGLSYEKIGKLVGVGRECARKVVRGTHIVCRQISALPTPPTKED